MLRQSMFVKPPAARFSARSTRGTILCKTTSGESAKLRLKMFSGTFPAIAAVRADDATPAGEGFMRKDHGGLTVRRIGHELRARGEHGGPVPPGRDPLRVGDLAGMMEQVAEIIE